jgi:TRAP-type C4-dicarboxylate transport system permease small subunit
MRKVQTAVRRILNIIVTGLSLFFSVIIIMYIYTSLTPSKAMGIAFKPGFTEIIIALMLLGSTLYYFKSGHQNSKTIATGYSRTPSLHSPTTSGYY